MDSERWTKIDRLLDQAMERPREARNAFLAVACAGDDELRREVESLLDAQSHSESFLGVPALDVAARDLADEKNLSLVGNKFGAYQVLSVLGVGGMGEVYRARDARLARDVAIKVLHADAATDPDPPSALRAGS